MTNSPAPRTRMSQPVHYTELSEALARLGYAENPAEFHGALCGALCANDAEQVDVGELLEAGGSTVGEAAGDDARALAQLRGESAVALGSAEMSFAPLLPDDEQSLAARVEALAAWCHGFLFGLTTGRPLNMKQCSPELKELLRDFTQFTQAGVDSGDDPGIEENAYAELIEYIRVGVQLIFMELQGHGTEAPAAEPSKTLH